MPKRISSTKLEIAQRRLEGIKRIDPSLELGPEVPAESYAKAIEETRQRLEAYNAAVAALETERIALKEAERKLQAITVKVLPAVAVKYGKESPQYSMVGGVRPSEQKRPVRPPKMKKGEVAA